MTSHWGTLPPRSRVEPGVAALEREQMTRLRPMEVQGAKLYQPSLSTLSSKKVPAEMFAIDELTLHTIKLLQFIKKIKAQILSVQQQRENTKNGEGDVLSFPPAPAIPELLKSLKQRPKQKFPFVVKNTESNFVRGFGETAPEIDTPTNRSLLRRSVAAMCAHAGFDLCSESALETLTDVCDQYFLRMTRLLRSAVDSEALNGTAGFQDVIQRVFYEIGIGNPTVLHEFYQSRIVQYHNNLQLKCENLLAEYDHVTSASYNPQSANLVHIKEEPLSEDIMFPLTDDRPDKEDIDETEELLQLAGLSGFDIKLEQDPGTGISSDEVDSQTVKTDSVDTRLLEAYGDPDSVTENNPRSPHFSTSDMSESVNDSTGQSTDIMSPPPQVGRPKKKKKR